MNGDDAASEALAQRNDIMIHDRSMASEIERGKPAGWDRWARATAALLVLVHCALLLRSAALNSPTMDEPAHLVAGLSNWRLQRFDVYRVNPPLIRLLATLPASLMNPRLTWNSFNAQPGVRAEFALGEEFMRVNGRRGVQCLYAARCVCILFSGVGAYLCFLWAARLGGSPAGLLAVFFWVSCPLIIGHGQLLTCDVPAATLGLASIYAYSRWLVNPTWMRAFAVGILLGLAQLAKFTLLLLYPTFIVLLIAWRVNNKQSSNAARLAMLVAAFAISVYVLNLGYAFEGVGRPLGDYDFVSALFGGPGAHDGIVGNRFAEHWLGRLPLPVPANYVTGFDLQQRDFEAYGHPSYLRGQFRTPGWWYYYLYGLLVKLPQGFLALLALSLVAQFRRRAFDHAVLLVPAIAILGSASLRSEFTGHVRYVLPALPLLSIWAAVHCGEMARQSAILACVVVGALGHDLLDVAQTYPHTLSYFNRLAGGPANGAFHLLHSNIDWGQDLFFLRAWMADHPEAQPFTIVYCGSASPRSYGIEHAAFDEMLSEQDGRFVARPGWYAISVNFVHGLPHLIHDGDGNVRQLPLHALSGFQTLTPTARVGGSINVYRVTRTLSLPSAETWKGVTPLADRTGSNDDAAQ